MPSQTWNSTTSPRWSISAMQDEDEAVFVWAQRAHAGGEGGREHGDGAVREVDAGAAEAGFEIKRGGGLDVVADICDVDLELPVAVGQRLDEDGVVEVAGGFAIDGDDGEAAEIMTEGELFRAQRSDGLGGGVVSFSEDVGGEDVGETVLADDDFDVYAEVVGVAEDFEDAALSGAAEGWEVGDFDVDSKAFEGLVLVAGVEVERSVGAEGAVIVAGWGEDGCAVGSARDEDGLGHALVEGGDVVVAAAAVGIVVRSAAGAGVVEDADDGGVAAGEYAEDAAGTAGLAVGAWAAGGRFVDEDFITLHGAVELVGGDKEVVFTGGAAVRANEAEAVTVEIELAGDEVFAGVAGGWRLVGAGLEGARACGFFGGAVGEGPLAGVEFDEVSADGDTGELLEEETALAAAAEAELADELLVAGAVGRGCAR